jgi:hypothetical protein
MVLARDNLDDRWGDSSDVADLISQLNLVGGHNAPVFQSYGRRDSLTAVSAATFAGAHTHLHDNANPVAQVENRQSMCTSEESA